MKPEPFEGAAFAQLATFSSSQKTILPRLKETVPATISSSALSMKSLAGLCVQLNSIQTNEARAFTETSNSQRFPVETWQTILENLTRPRDLYNVAITSRYIHDIVTPILYRRLFIDPNYYSTYTFSLLRRDPALARRITTLTLLPPIYRAIPTSLREESTKLYCTLDIPFAPIPEDVQFQRNWSPAGMPLLPDLDQELYTRRPILHLFPLFTNLSTLHIVKDCVPADFLLWICELPQLTTLEIRDSTVSPDLKRKYPPTPLPLRTLTLVKCWARDEPFGSYIPGHVCEGLLKNAPFLTSLTIDLFVERMACHILSGMTHPPPLKTLSCHGLGPADPDGSLFCSVLVNLPTITSLHIARASPELGPILPRDSLPQLQALTGELKSLGIFFGVHRPLQYLTIIDSPVNCGRTPWERQLIYFLESVWKHETSIKSLAFNLTTWSEEVFLCICQLWPGLKELRIQCTSGPGVDEVCLFRCYLWLKLAHPSQYFRISFGPRFLPQLRHLEVLHIYKRASQLRFTRHRISKGVPVIFHYPINLSPEEVEELEEAPIHYRRWEKLCPSLREVAFDREFWWRRAFTEPGGWALMTDIIPALQVS